MNGDQDNQRTKRIDRLENLDLQNNILIYRALPIVTIFDEPLIWIVLLPQLETRTLCDELLVLTMISELSAMFSYETNLFCTD